MHKAFLLIFALSANSEIFCYLCIGHIFALLLILLTILGAPQKHDHFSATAMLPDQCNNPFSKTTHKIKWKWKKLKKISLLRDAKLVISNQFRFFSSLLQGNIFFREKLIKKMNASFLFSKYRDSY